MFDEDMFCIVALIVLSILGIFSATHRQMAKEALGCVLRRVTFRPCNTGFKEKMKGKILGKLINRSVTAARIFNKYFEVFAWIFMILMVWSTVWSVRGAYNFYYYGSCNGLNQSGFCPFDPTGANNQISQADPADGGVCLAHPKAEEDLSLGDFNPDDFQRIKNDKAQNQVVFIGCYSCEYTRKTYPIIRKILKENKNDVDFTFAHFAVKGNTDYLSKYDYVIYKKDPIAFWKFNDLLFESSLEQVSDREYVDGLVQKIGLDVAEIKKLVDDPETQKVVDRQAEQIKSTGIYGTPTVFINGKALVGPKPERVYENMLE